MSLLGGMLAKLGEAHAERLVFAPGEVPQAFEGERSWPLDGARVRAATLLEALSEILSHDELEAIPSNRPRIVRHEHEGAQYVVEVARENGALKLGVRYGKPTIRKESIREPSQPPKKDSVRPPAKRADKRTVRVDLDDEGNPVDTTTVDVERRKTIPGIPAADAARPEFKPVKRASRAMARRPVHQTLVVRAGESQVVSGDPSGAHVTFLYAPGGFALESAAGVVTASPEHAIVRGELYVPPSMKLRVLPGSKESIVSFYRHLD